MLKYAIGSALLFALLGVGIYLLVRPGDVEVQARLQAIIAAGEARRDQVNRTSEALMSGAARGLRGARPPSTER